MAKQTWTPSAKLALAIGKIEEQNGGSLKDWGTGEHLACIRYLVGEHVSKEGKLDQVALKETFKAESAFLAYASNAKKMLVEAKLLSSAAAAGGYE